MKKRVMLKIFFAVGVVLCVGLLTSAGGYNAIATAAESTYSETVNVPGVSAAVLYEKANLWFSDTFKGPDPNNIPYPGFTVPQKSRIISADRDKGIIEANYTFLTDETKMPYTWQIWFVYSTVQIQVSDGQYRLVFSKPANQAATYNERDKLWIYTKEKYTYPKGKPPLHFKRYVEATQKVWHTIASLLRETLGGTLADN
jgi:hypothetical protein